MFDSPRNDVEANGASTHSLEEVLSQPQCGSMRLENLDQFDHDCPCNLSRVIVREDKHSRQGPEHAAF